MLETSKFKIKDNEISQTEIRIKSNRRAIYLDKNELNELKDLLTDYINLKTIRTNNE